MKKLLITIVAVTAFLLGCGERDSYRVSAHSPRSVYTRTYNHTHPTVIHATPRTYHTPRYYNGTIRPTIIHGKPYSGSRVIVGTPSHRNPHSPFSIPRKPHTIHGRPSHTPHKPNPHNRSPYVVPRKPHTDPRAPRYVPNKPGFTPGGRHTIPRTPHTPPKTTHTDRRDQNGKKR